MKFYVCLSIDISVKSIINNYNKFKKAIFILLLLPLFWFGIKAGWNKANSDFPNYYVSAQLLVKGGLNDAYNVALFNQHIRNYNKDAQGLFVMYPPTTALLAVPLTIFDLLNAKRIWIILSLCSALGIVLLISKICDIDKIDAANIFLLCGFNFYNDLMLGQVYTLMLFLLFWGWYAAIKNKNLVSGLSWGILAAIKFLPLFFIPVLLFKKQYTNSLMLLFTFITIHLICFFTVGSNVYQSFIEVFTSNYIQGKVANDTPLSIQYQSIEVIANLAPQHFDLSDGMINFIKLFWKIGWLLLAAIIGLKYIKSKSLMSIALASLILLLLLFENGSATYHLLFALFALIVFLNEIKDKFWQLLGILSFAAMGFIPVITSVLAADNLFINFSRLWCLSFFAACFFIGCYKQHRFDK